MDLEIRINIYFFLFLSNYFDSLKKKESDTSEKRMYSCRVGKKFRWLAKALSVVFLY